MKHQGKKRGAPTDQERRHAYNLIVSGITDETRPKEDLLPEIASLLARHNADIAALCQELADQITRVWAWQGVARKYRDARRAGETPAAHAAYDELAELEAGDCLNPVDCGANGLPNSLCRACGDAYRADMEEKQQ